MSKIETRILFAVLLAYLASIDRRVAAIEQHMMGRAAPTSAAAAVLNVVTGG